MKNSRVEGVKPRSRDVHGQWFRAGSRHGVSEQIPAGCRADCSGFGVKGLGVWRVSRIQRLEGDFHEGPYNELPMNIVLLRVYLRCRPRTF